MKLGPPVFIVSSKIPPKAFEGKMYQTGTDNTLIWIKELEILIFLALMLICMCYIFNDNFEYRQNQNPVKVNKLCLNATECSINKKQWRLLLLHDEPEGTIGPK